MALSYNLGYQESISVHPTRRQIFAGKSDSTFWNIWEWVISSTHLVNMCFKQRKEKEKKSGRYVNIKYFHENEGFSCNRLWFVRKRGIPRIDLVFASLSTAWSSPRVRANSFFFSSWWLSIQVFGFVYLCFGIFVFGFAYIWFVSMNSFFFSSCWLSILVCGAVFFVFLLISTLN